MPTAGPLLHLPPTPFRPTDVIGLKGFAAMGASLLGQNWYIRIGGSNNNGGSSNTLAAERTGTDGVANNTTTFTSATANFTNADVNKGICIGTGNAARRHKIASVSNSTTVLLVRADTTSGSGQTWAIGGAWADLRAPLADAAVTAGGNQNTPMSAGDTCYIGGGTYRATCAVGNALSHKNFINFVGDFDGLFTGDVGLARFTSFTTNDTTTAVSTSCLNTNNANYLRFKNIMLTGGNTAGGCLVMANSMYLEFYYCAFMMPPISNAVQLTATAGFAYARHLLFESCVSLSGTWLFSPPLGQYDYDADIVIQNSTLMNFGSASAVDFSPPAGAQPGHPGGMRIRNCWIAGATPVIVTRTNASIAIPCTIDGSVIWGGGINATTTGQIIEQNNYFASARTNVNIGAGSYVGIAMDPSMYFGQESIFGGMFRPFGEPMPGSALLGLGRYDTAQGSLDRRKGPRPSTAARQAGGSIQRGNNAIQTAAVVQAGSSALQITGDGFGDFDVPVDAGAITLSVYIRYDGSYIGPLPRMMVTKGTQIGVGDYELPVSTNSLNTYVQYSITINPTASGILTLRIISGDTSGVGNVYADTFATA